MNIYSNMTKVVKQDYLNITNKFTRSYIFGKRLKHVRMLKTIKFDILQALSWGRRHTVYLFSENGLSTQLDAAWMQLLVNLFVILS